MIWILLAATTADLCPCNACQGVLKRTHVPAFDARAVGLSRLMCEPLPRAPIYPLEAPRVIGLSAPLSECTCDHCYVDIPEKLSNFVRCRERPGRTPLSFAQQTTATQLLACPEPKPCVCQCHCDPVMYGTPVPLPPTPFPTGEPPKLSMLQDSIKKSLRGPGPIVLGPPPPPLPMTPPPTDRSFCPKAAACNCFCPCRDL